MAGISGIHLDGNETVEEVAKGGGFFCKVHRSAAVEGRRCGQPIDHHLSLLVSSYYGWLEERVFDLSVSSRNCRMNVGGSYVAETSTILVLSVVHFGLT